mgnify:CR=1 FL=1
MPNHRKTRSKTTACIVQCRAESLGNVMEVRNMAINIAGITFEDGPYPIAQAGKLKNAPGVYVIRCRSSSGNTLIDVGQSDNVRDRVMNHDRKECWNKHCKGKLEVAATYIPEEQQRLNIEKQIRQRYNPPCGER